MNIRFAAVPLLAIVALACGTSQPTASPRTTQPPSPAPTLAPTVPPTLSPTLPPPTMAPTPSPLPSPTAGGAAVLLEVTNEGGFIAPSAHLGELPSVVVDTAGDIYTADPNATAQTLVPAVVVRDVGANGAAQILAAMRAAGLDQEGSSGVPGDAGVTVFTAQIDGQEIVNRVAPGGPGGPGHPGASPNPAIDLLNRLLDPAQTWGAADVSNAHFAPIAYKVYVAPATDTGSTVDWPLTTALAAFGTPAQPDFGVTGLRTGVVLDADAATLASTLGATPAGTLVKSDGQAYQVWIRPLLPPELTQ